MTRFEIELLAIALYESQARVFFEREGFSFEPWLNTKNDVQDQWRRAARELLAEPTAS